MEEQMTPQQLLQSILPKDPEQKKIFLHKLSEYLEKERKIKVNHGIDTGFNGTFQQNAMEQYTTDGYSNSRNYRKVARIPKELLAIAKEVYGDDVITNDAKFKKAFVDDEVGRLCLTVDPKKI